MLLTLWVLFSSSVACGAAPSPHFLLPGPPSPANLPPFAHALHAHPVLGAAFARHTPEDRCTLLKGNTELEFSQELRNTVVGAGKRVELACEVSSAPQAVIVWLHNGQVVQVSEGAQEEEANGRSVGSSIVTSRLSIPCASSASSGEYSCVALSPCSTPITSSAVVVVKENPAAEHACIPTRAPPSISVFTVARIEHPSNIVQFMCRTESSNASISWEAADEEGAWLPIDGALGIQVMKNGDLIVDPIIAGGEDVVSLNYRCTVRTASGMAREDASFLAAEAE